MAPPALMGRPAGLCCRAQFVDVQTHGRRHRGTCLTLLARTGTSSPARVGLTVSRRVGNAVVRNRVRRRLREIVWALGDAWPEGTDMVVIAHPGSPGASFPALAAGLASLLARACRPRPAGPPRGGRRA